METGETVLAAAMKEWFRITGDTAQIDIKAVPGASKNCFAGIKDNRLCVRIAAAAEDGRANAALIGFLAKALGCPKRDVELIRGEKSRLKTVAVPKACAEKVEAIPRDAAPHGRGYPA
jgi:uncharacterized protein (TIGR00251 family)